MLIVDDEEKIRELIKKYALFEGYEVEESGDGMDAVEKCRKKEEATEENKEEESEK